MNIKSDVEILRNLFEEAIDQIPKIYKQNKTIRIPFDEEYTDCHIQELAIGKRQITSNWRQAEELMFLIETVQEVAESFKKPFHFHTGTLLTQLYETLKNELNEFRELESAMTKGDVVLLQQLDQLSGYLSTFPSYKKSRHLTLNELSIRTLLKLMSSMLKDKNIFYSMDVDILLRISDLLKDISIKRRNKKLTFPFNVTKLFRNMKSKVTQTLNARLHLKEEVGYSQSEGEYRPLPVSDLSDLKGEFWETFDHLKGVAEKIMNFPK